MFALYRTIQFLVLQEPQEESKQREDLTTNPPGRRFRLCDGDYGGVECRTTLLRRYWAIAFQFLARWSAVRHASAWTVSVGLRAPLVPMTDAPSTPRLGAS